MAFTSNVSTTVTSETVSYGTQSIVSSGIANYAVVFYGNQNISSGGVAKNTAINTSGYQYVSSGGIASNTTINTRGSQYVSSGGTANNTSIFSVGDQYVLSGGAANNTTINSGGEQYVSSSGVANSTTINSGGDQYVLSGGAANNTTINSGGEQYVSSSGVANSTTINSGAYQYAGGLTSQSMVQSGGMLMIGAGGSATDITISSGGIMGWDFNVVFSGTSNGTAVVISSTDTSYNMYLKRNVTQYVSSGYTANSTTINSGGGQIVSSAGTASSTVVNNGGSQTVLSGGTAYYTTINIRGSQYISYGGTANSTNITDSTSVQTVAGVANYTVMNTGGQIVSSGGVANFTTVNSAACGQQIASGGVANFTTINYRGWQTVLSGGTASSTTINNGFIIISSGGSANVINQLAYGMIEADTGAIVTSGTNTRTDGHSAFSIVSGIASNFLLSGGNLSVLSGNSAIDTLISSDGCQYVSSGGTVNYTTVNFMGDQFIYAGGNASNSIINSSGTQYISGGTANSTTLSGGSQNISSGGVANYTSVFYNGRQYIYLSGTANSTTISSCGSQNISSGGVANYTNIYSGGAQNVIFCGVASNTIINSGGAQNISSGGIASSTTVTVGAQNVYGLAILTDINSGGAQNILSGGIASSATISSGGSQNISSGGIASSATVAGGNQNISSGGIASSTTVTGGNQNISSSGIASSTTISSSGSQNIFLGGSAIYVTVTGGNQNISSGGIAIYTTLTGGSQNILFGGTASSSTVSGGNQNISSGGTASSTIINSSGSQNIFAGGVVNSTTISSGGDQNISSGGTANFTTIKVSGGQYIFSGGTVNSTTISSGGSQNIFSGGSAFVINQLTGAAVITNTGATITGGINNRIDGHSAFSIVNGVASNFLASNGGQLTVLSGHSAIDTLIATSGYQYISSGGTAYLTTINAGGNQNISSGGTVNSTTISSGGSQAVYGVGNSTIISSGGSQAVYGVVFSTTINSRGYQYIFSGGSASVINQLTGAAIITDTGATITGGTNTRTDGHSAFFIVNGIASNFIMSNNGQLTVLSGHSAIDTIIATSGYQYVSSGGTANSTAVSSGGSQAVLAGGTGNSTTISYGGSQAVYGTANSTAVSSGGIQTIFSGGTANSTTINYWGSQHVSSGGIANSTTISSGYQYVSSGGTANSTTINFWGKQYVSSGGTANSTIINSSARQDILSGGTANSTTINYCGGQFASYGGIVNFTTISSGGSQSVASSAVANSTTINSGGSQSIFYGGSAGVIDQRAGAAIITNTYAKITGGVNIRTDGHSAFSIVNGMASNFLLENGGKLEVSSGHSAVDTLITSGGYLFVWPGGLASLTTISSGGRDEICSGGTASMINQKSGAIIITNTGATITGGTNTRADGHSAFSIVNGAAGNFLLENGGRLDISSGNSAIDTLIASNGYLYVNFSGIANSTTINASGIQVVSSGVANYTNINGGMQMVSSGGIANSTTIVSGGLATVFGGGTANFTTINSGGIQGVMGSAYSTVINAGGTQYIDYLGIANITVVNSGGSMVVSSGGIVSNVLTVAGGHVILANAASFNSLTTVSYVLTTATTGDALITVNGGTLGTGATAYSLNLDNTASGSYILADGDDLTGMNGKTFSVTDNGQNVNVQVGFSYTFADGDKLSLTFTDAVRDQLTATFTVGTGGAFTPVVSTTVTSETVVSGTQSIVNGGIANNTIINISGYQNISSGGVATSTTINSGGYQNVSFSGIASFTTVNSGGNQTISSGGVASNTTINGGCSTVVSGGTATTTWFGGNQYVSSGGTATGTTINSGGSQFVYLGGIATNISIGVAAGQTVYSGGTATFINVGYAGGQTVCGTVISTFVQYGGAQYVSSGGTANITTIYSRGVQYVSSGGTANNTSIYGAPSDYYTATKQYVYSGGVANSTSISFGSQIVSGTANSTTINLSATQTVFAGGVASNTAINQYGSQFISGEANTTIINSDGSQSVYSGGVANDTTINSGGSQSVYTGGAANDTTINSGGSQTVISGGTANSTTINLYGYQYISSGGVANSTIIFNSGFQAVSSGGTANDNTINDGYQRVSGTANNTVINSGGQQEVSGGTANITIINSSGDQYIYSCCTANSTTINISGHQYISSGGIASDTAINGGVQRVNGTATITAVNSGGSQSVSSGGTANGTTINSGGLQLVFSGGTANNTEINISGIQNVSSGGTANSTTIYNFGSQYVSSGGVANNTTISGFAGSQYISSGGTVSSTIIYSGGQGVSSGGTAVDTNIFRGYQNIYNGGIANSTTINDLGWQFVSSGGKASNTIINSSYQRISSGGIANSTTINSSGWQNVFGGGVANFSIINSGGQQIISSGATANNTTVNAGGLQAVSSGGRASDSIVNSGGSMYISSGGITSSSLTIAGGHVTLADASAAAALTTMRYELTNALTNDILLTVNNGTLGTGGTAYSLDLNNTALGTYILASGADLSGMSGKNFTVTYNSQNITLQVGSSYTFGSDSKLSLSFTDAATDQLTAIFSEAVLPSVPAGLTRTVTGNNVALDWMDSTDASGIKQYEIQVDNNSNFSSPEYSASPAVSNANASGLADGNYYWRVRTLDNSGNYSDWTTGSSFTVDVTAPSVPATLTRTVTGSSVVLDWADATDATSGVKQYEFQVDNNSNFSSNEKSGIAVSSDANATGLSDGTYYWRVRTQDNSGNYSTWSSGSNFIVDATAPSVPATLIRTVTGSSVALDWADATDATSGVKQYEFQVDNNDDFSSNEKSGTAAVSNATATSLADGNYYWRVRSMDNSGNYSDWTTGSSFTVDVTAPSVPATLTRTVTGNSVALDWADATDATSSVKQYDFQIDNNSDFSSNEKTGTAVVSNANVTSLADGNYYWRVRTLDNSGNYSAWTSGSNFTVDITAPSVPATLTRTVIGSSVVLDWADATDATSGVKQYDFQVDNNSDFTSNEKSGTSVSSNANATGLADGNYYWRVRTLDNSGNYSDWSNGSNFTVDMTAPSVPVTLTRTVTGSSVALDWADASDATSGVKQYEFQVDNNSDFSSNEKSGTAVVSNASVTSLAEGTYYWRVRSQDNSGNYSAWSSGSNFTVDITAPSVPAALTRTVTGSSVAFDWADATDATSGVKQYDFQVDNNSDFSSNEKSGTAVDSNANVTSLADGNYYWRVRTLDNSGNYSTWSSGSSFIVDMTAPSVPSGMIQTLNGKNITLDWNDVSDAVSGVKQYAVQVDNNSDFSSPEYSASPVISTANLSVVADGKYYWRVRSLDNSGNYSAWSTTANFNVEMTPPTVPTSLKQTVTGSSVALDWADSTDASGIKQYELRVDKSSDFSSPEYSTLIDVSAASASLALGTYYWQVRAQDKSGNYSAWSSSSKFIVTPTDTAGNTWQTANDIANLDNWVGTGDAADYYKITMTNAGMLTLGLTGLTGNADLSLLNSAGTAIKTSSNAGVTPEAINNVALLAGIYYVKVAAGTSVNDASYTLSNTIKYCPTDKAANDYKTALDISNLDNWVGFGDSADFYKLTMTNAGTLTLGLTGLTGNADLSLLSSTGTVLKSSSNAGTTNEAINNVALLAGTYYVKVAAGTGVNDASYTLSNTIKYCPTDKAANDYKTAQDISNLDNWVGFGDAADFYKLTMTNAGTLTLGLTGLTGNADLSLLSSTGTVLKSSSNTGTTPEAINNVALLAGTYYVKVAAGTSVNDASYTLSNTIKYCPTDKAANDYKTALDISNLDNWVGFGDTADFYKLTMTNAGTLSLSLTGLTGNADLSLLNSAGTALKTSSNTGTTPETINNVALLAGIYYVKVAAGTSVNDASYTLSNTIKYCPTDKAANDYKTAQDISNLDNWVGFGDAADFYKLTMTNAGALTLALTGLTGNADLSLLNASGIAIKTSSNTGTTPEAINNVALLAGTYYVKVAAGTSVNDASYNLTNTIKYCPTDKAANDYKTAQDISNLDNWVGFGDAADFYKLTMTNAGTLSLGLTGLTGNADLSLLSSTGTMLKSSSNTGTTSEAINNVALLAGTYYVKVAAGTSVNDAAYTLTHTEKYCPTDTAANDYATAKDIKSGVDNWVGFGDSADFYKLTMTNAGTLSLDLTGLTGNVDMSLLSSTGTVLKSSANTGITNEAISSVSLLAGTYYVKIATGFGVNDARYTLSDLEKYFPLDNAGSTQGTAKLVDSPTQTGWVGFGDSDDYYRFDLANTAQETLRLHDMTGGNADLTLYDSKGTMLQKSAKTGALEDTITRNLAAGTYYARVTAVSGNIDYKLDFSKKDIVSGMLAS